MNKCMFVLMLLASGFAQANEPETASNVEEQSSLISADKFSISLGLGIPYGVLGPSVNYRGVDFAEIFIAKGTRGEAFGARVYPITQFPRARLSVFHGVNTLLGSCTNESCDIVEDEYSGWNISAGVGPEAGVSGWEFDVIFIIDQGNYKDDLDKAEEAGFILKEEKNAVQLSFGYRWNF